MFSTTERLNFQFIDIFIWLSTDGGWLKIQPYKFVKLKFCCKYG